MQSSNSSIFYEVSGGSSDSSDEETEVVTSALKLVADIIEHTSNPPKPILTRKQIVRERGQANKRLMKDYFDASPTYKNPETFRRRFRMSKRLFLRITQDLEQAYPYFQQKRDGRGTLGFTPIQKCCSALRVLGYGNTTDINDEYLKMAEKTTRDTTEHFARGIIELYGARYLRKPTMNDLQRLYDVHAERHGLPGMIGSIDCMHWPWSNCPTAWRGQHTRGDQKRPTLILQAVASQDLWIWNAFFGVAGSNNDINVLEASPIIEDFVSGSAPVLPFYVNGNYHPHGYFLGDGIYPEYSFIVKTFKDPLHDKRDNFRKFQESARKDIERAFGVLKQRWHFVRNPCRLWTKDKIRDVMYVCIILHNMILEDDGLAFCQDYQPGHVQELPEATIDERVQNADYMRSKAAHNELMKDLVEHTWTNRWIPDNDDEDEEANEEEDEADD